MPLEKTIVRNILKKSNARLGCYARKIHGNRYNAGFPDVVICQLGKMLMVEAKQPGKKPTPLQVVELAKWGAAGSRVLVAYGWGEVRDVLDDMLDESDSIG